MESGSFPIESTVQPGETTFSRNFIMVVRFRGDFSDEELSSALDRLRVRHARLIPAAATDAQDISHFPLRVLAGCGDTDWVDVAKAEFRRRFAGESGPFARFALLRSADFSFGLREIRKLDFAVHPEEV